MADLRGMLAVNTNPASPLDANAEGAQGAVVSNFVTVQSFSTFAVAVPVLKTIWELLKGLADAGWTKSYWTPFVICMAYGIWQFLISVSGDKGAKQGMTRLSAFVIAVVNAAILAAAVIGLTETTGFGED